MLTYFLSRLAEASTLRGLILFAGGLAGFHLSEADAQTLTSAALLLAGVAGAALPDRLRKAGG